MHKLSLDPSKTFGWCLVLDDSGKPEAERRPMNQRLHYGTWDLQRDEENKKCGRRGQFGWNLWSKLNALLRQHEIDGEDIEIVLEGESYGSQKSEAGRRMAAMWLVVMEMWAERKSLPYPVTCPPDTWRLAFVKCAKAPKEIGAGLRDAERYEARRAWLKDRVLTECRKRNLKPQNDNEADAIGLMFWLVNDGPEALEQKREEKKAKASAKRAQKKLDLQVAA